MIIQILFKKNALIFCSIVILCCSSEIYGNPDAKRLYDDLLSNYNKLVRPVMNVTNALSVKIKLKLSQLIDVNLKNQIMTTNVWIEQSWYDYKLKWNPEDYGSVDMLFVPSDNIWRPDIVLYNNADGNFEVTLATKATLHYTGKVEWNPPAIYKSSCEIDVEYFPFDEQTCVMKFGSWTYDGFQVDLRHKDETKGSSIVDLGIDLKDFYTSVEWDILEVPAIRGEKFYTCCEEPYLDITFNITMRRKTLFYTVNLIIPCMGIAFLTILVFYLPSDSGEKVSLSISILLSLTVFFLLLAEIIPPTSLVVPLLGKFVLFTMILDTLSICVTVIVLNVHFRCPQTHIMNPWVKRVFIHVLPRLLVMKRPQYMLDRSRFHSHQSMWIQSGNNDQYYYNSGLELESQEMISSNYREAEETRLLSCRIHGTTSPIIRMSLNNVDGDYEAIIDPFLSALAWHQCPEVHKAMDGVRFIACHIKREEDSIRVKEDWKYVAMVLDRLFLWIFTTAVVVGTAGIILQAPTLYDDREPIDRKISEIATRVKSYSASRVSI